jgi:hypothetical protein
MCLTRFYSVHYVWYSIYWIFIANCFRNCMVRTRVRNRHRVPMVHLDTSAWANRSSFISLPRPLGSTYEPDIVPSVESSILCVMARARLSVSSPPTTFYWLMNTHSRPLSLRTPSHIRAHGLLHVHAFLQSTMAPFLPSMSWSDKMETKNGVSYYI